MELWVGENGLAGHFIEGNVLRRKLGCRGDIQAVTHAIRVGDGPLQCLHAAQAATDDSSPLADSQAVGQARLAVYPVFHGQYREVGAIGLAGDGIEAAGAGTAVATAEVVQADHEEAIGIDGLAWANAAVPPARLAVVGAVVARRMMVAGQRMADQHGVAGRAVEGAIGFVDQFIAGQRATASQRQGLVELCQLRCYQTDRIFGKDSGHRPCSRLNEA
ncbi:hypothetical protein D3C80_886090 [compost metagenome]